MQRFKYDIKRVYVCACVGERVLTFNLNKFALQQLRNVCVCVCLWMQWGAAQAEV